MKERLYVALYGFADVTAKRVSSFPFLYRPSKSYGGLQVSTRVTNNKFDWLFIVDPI